MITIRPTKAGKEYLNDKSEQAEKVLMSVCGGNEDKSVAKIMRNAIKLLEKTQNEKGTTETNSSEDVNFLIVNKLASIVETPQSATNHLSQVHVATKEPIEAINPEPNQNALAEAHTVKGEEQLGEVPEVLPTHLGNIELETETEEETND